MRQACPARRPVVNRPLEMRPASAWTLQGEDQKNGLGMLNACSTREFLIHIWIYMEFGCMWSSHAWENIADGWRFQQCSPSTFPPKWWSTPSFSRFQLWLAWCELSRRDLPINQKGHQEPHQHWTCYPDQPQMRAWYEMRGRLNWPKKNSRHCTKRADIFKLTKRGSGASPPPLPWQTWPVLANSNLYKWAESENKSAAPLMSRNGLQVLQSWIFYTWLFHVGCCPAVLPLWKRSRP